MFFYTTTGQPGEERVVIKAGSPAGEGKEYAEDVMAYDLPSITTGGQAFGVGDAMNKAAEAVYNHLQKFGAEK